MYRDYLRKQDYAHSTVESYIHAKSRFTGWCGLNGYQPETIDYKACLLYVKDLQKPRNGKRVTKRTVKFHVGSLKIFFNYLIDENHRSTNPFSNMNIRGIKRTVNHNLLSFEELEDLYFSYPIRNIKAPYHPSVAVRNKVITGLMVYQGLSTTSLKSLKLEHVHVENGTIYIPSTRKTNSRTLELKSCQVIPLLQYIEQDRQILQEGIQNYTDDLFPLNSNRFSFVVREVIKRLKRINHKVKDIKQVRASVITHWLDQHNVRQVQYMAGHRYISSTESYVQDDLENLHEIVDSLHPIG